MWQVRWVLEHKPFPKDEPLLLLRVKNWGLPGHLMSVHAPSLAKGEQFFPHLRDGWIEEQHITSKEVIWYSKEKEEWYTMKSVLEDNTPARTVVTYLPSN
jgi:hypothetical protein